MITRDWTDKHPIKKAKFIREYMGEKSEKVTNELGKKQLKVLLGQAIKITPLKPNSAPYKNSTFEYTLNKIEEMNVVITLPIHQNETSTTTEMPTTTLPALTPPLTNHTNGHYYNRTTGELIRCISSGSQGQVLDLYACSGHTESNGVLSFQNPMRLSINSRQFKKVCSIVKHEGATNHELEYICIAYASRNEAASRGTSIYQLLMGAYSSVPSSQKIELPDTNNTARAKAARKGVLMALSGQPDPTNGSRFWDGTDFLAWGLVSPNGTPQNKFEEYNRITIARNVYDTFLAANLTKYPSGHVSYYGHSYSIPAAVFLATQNWTNGAFNYAYSAAHNRPNELKAEISAGLSIFWSVH